MNYPPLAVSILITMPEFSRKLIKNLAYKHVVKKSYLGSGLAVLLGLGYWNSYAQDPPPAQTPLESVVPKLAAEQDEYRQYIQNLQIVPPSLSQKPKPEECNKRDLKNRHQKKLEDIANKVYHRSGLHPDHHRYMLLDEVVDADVKLAHCFYKPGSASHTRLMREVIQHYEGGDFEREIDAARVYLYLGDLRRARELFYQRSYDEEVIKLTPENELPALQERALQEGKALLAGKVEWLQGNKERARELIKQWEGFSGVIKNARKKIQEGNYFLAIDYSGDSLKIPFYREIIEEECKNNASCLELLRNYNMNQDNTKALINHICKRDENCLLELQRATGGAKQKR